MILSKTIIVKLHPNNIKHYKSLGYAIPTYYDKNHNCWRFKRGTTIEVKIEHLTKGSHVKILCECDGCHKKLLLNFYHLKNLNNQLCKLCAMNTETVKYKISKNSLGRKHTPETKLKMSKNSWSKTHPAKLSPFYNSNIPDIERLSRGLFPENKVWIRKIKKLYKVCFKCGATNKLCAHHINNFSQFKDQRIDINNGITLCTDCHKIIHKIYGKFTKLKDLINFLNFS